MERQIKFRAFIDNEMVELLPTGLQYYDFEGSYVASFAVDGYTGFWAHENYDHKSMKERLSKAVLMQFTGLLDSNGKEIYEGDMLMYIASNMSNMLVKFENGMFVGEGAFNTHSLHTYITALDFVSIEVMGNLYENPELLQ